MGNTIKFGQLTAAKKEDIKAIVQDAQDKATSRQSVNTSNVNSIFNNNETDGNKNSTANVAIAMAGGQDALNELSEKQIKEYATLAALMDADGDGTISDEEFEAAARGSGSGNVQQFDAPDIDELYNSIDIADEEQLEALTEEINAILADLAPEAAQEVKGINLENSGVKQNDDGTFSVEVERYGSSVDGRNANSTLYGIIGNAYPDLSTEDREAVLNQIAEMNGIEDVNLIITGQEIKLPVISHDDDGNIQFSEKAEEAENTEDNDSSVGEEKVLYGDQNGYHIQVTNEDGSITTFTRAYDGTESAKTTTSADGSQKQTVYADGRTDTYNYEDGQLSSLTVKESDGTTKEYEYADANYREGHPTTIKTTNSDGTYSIETRTYNEDGSVASKDIQNYDAEGQAIETENSEIYNDLLSQLNSEADINERASLLNTALSGDYGLSAQQKADLINEVLGGMNVEGDAQYVKGNKDIANDLRTNINSVITQLSDEELVDFAQQFATSYGASLNDFMGQTKDNSDVNIAYVDRLVDLYSNAGSNLNTVLETFPITESVQELLKGDTETSKVQEILEGTLDNIQYEGGDLKVDNMAGKITSKSDLCDLLDDSSYTDEQKAYILSQLNPADLTAYIRDINSNSNEEEYLTQVLKLIADASV